MTNDELRALADALQRMADDDSGIPQWERDTTSRAADYLRACADAQPVATLTLLDDMGIQIDFRKSFTLLPGQTFFLYTHPAPAAPHYAMLDSHRRLVEQAIQSAEHPSGMSTHDGKARIDASVLRRMLSIIDSQPAPAGWKLVPVNPTPEMLASTSWPGCAGTDYAHMLAAAPAAPQAEPIDPHMIVADDRFPDAQAEPKRQPVSEATALIEWPESAKWKNRAAPEGIERSCMGEPKRGPLSDERIAEIQRAAYERAAQECIETAAELRRCADGCTDGRYDWKADGADDCADAIRALGRQHD